MGVTPEASSPCDGLTRSQHYTLYLLSRQARGKHKDVVADYEQLARIVYGNDSYWQQSRRDDVAHLSDEGYIEHREDLHFRLQQTCSHGPEIFSDGFNSRRVTAQPDPLGSGSPVRDRPRERQRSEVPEGGNASEGVRRRPLNAGDNMPPLAGVGVLTTSWEESVPGSERKPSTVDELARDYFPDRCTAAGLTYRPSEFRFLRNKLMYWFRHGESLDRLIIMVDQFVKHPEWCRRSMKQTSVVFVMHHANLIDLASGYEKRFASKSHRHDRDFWGPAFMRNARRIRVR